MLCVVLLFRLRLLMLVVGDCLICVACCVSFGLPCSLSVVRCALRVVSQALLWFVFRCVSLEVVVVRCCLLLCLARCVLCVVCRRSLVEVCCWLYVGCCVVFFVSYMLLGERCSLLAAVVHR